jgi:hypothetical protein
MVLFSCLIILTIIILIVIIIIIIIQRMSILASCDFKENLIKVLLQSFESQYTVILQLYFCQHFQAFASYPSDERYDKDVYIDVGNCDDDSCDYSSIKK